MYENDKIKLCFLLVFLCVYIIFWIYPFTYPYTVDCCDTSFSGDSFSYSSQPATCSRRPKVYFVPRRCFSCSRPFVRFFLLFCLFFLVSCFNINLLIITVGIILPIETFANKRKFVWVSIWQDGVPC